MPQAKLQEVYDAAEREGSTGRLAELSFFFAEMSGQGFFDEDSSIPTVDDTQTPAPQTPPEEKEPITIPVVEETADTSPDPQLLLPAPDTRGQDSNSIFDGSLTPYHLNILEVSQAQDSLAVYDNRASQLQSGLHRGENIYTGESESKQQHFPYINSRQNSRHTQVQKYKHFWEIYPKPK